MQGGPWPSAQRQEVQQCLLDRVPKATQREQTRTSALLGSSRPPSATFYSCLFDHITWDSGFPPTDESDR